MMMGLFHCPPPPLKREQGFFYFIPSFQQKKVPRHGSILPSDNSPSTQFTENQNMQAAANPELAKIALLSLKK